MERARVQAAAMQAWMGSMSVAALMPGRNPQLWNVCHHLHHLSRVPTVDDLAHARHGLMEADVEGMVAMLVAAKECLKDEVHIFEKMEAV